MPIRPECRHRYPANWPEIREQILARAGHRCEWEGCGLPDRIVGYRDELDRFIPAPEDALNVGGCYLGERVFRIVLTIAHLDHIPEHCEPSNLRALCQRHHLRYDIDHHRQTRYMRRHADANTLELFA